MKIVKTQRTPTFIKIKAKEFDGDKGRFKGEDVIIININDISYYTSKFNYLHLINGRMFVITDNDSTHRIINLLCNNLI